MPPAGFVGVKLTPQRKLMLNEVMQSENLTKPSEAIDLALALASDYVKPDESELTELPNFLNYFVGEAAPEELTPLGTTSPLVQRHNENAASNIAEGFATAAPTSLTWRREALSYIRNVEPTIVNVADAVDFALSAYIMATRSGSVSEERIAAVRSDVQRNTVALRHEVEEFLAENMADQERTARQNGTKSGNNRDARKKPTNKQHDTWSAMNIANGQLVHLYRKLVNETNKASKKVLTEAIENLEQKIRLLDRDLAMGEITAAVDASKESHYSAPVRVDANGEKHIDF